MKNTEQQDISDLSEFDDSISLFQLIPAGTGKALNILRMITDSVHNGRISRIPSVLITGAKGKRTHARGFIRALGYDSIKRIHGSLVYPVGGPNDFFSVKKGDAHLIETVETICPAFQLTLVQILSEQKFYVHNYRKQEMETFEVPGPVVLTSEDINKVVRPIVDAVDYTVQIEPHSPEQLELVVLQRLKYAGIEHESDELLPEIVSQGVGVLTGTVKFLKMCLASMRADGRDKKLLFKDIEKAVRLLKDDTDIPF